MDTRTLLLRLAALAFTSAVALPAAPGTLYKSVDANGTIVFSDVPPPSGARVVEQKRVAGVSSLPGALPGSGGSSATGLPVYEFPEFDADLARANAQVDLAEHALAVARQGLWSTRDGLRLVSARRTSEDEARVEYYRKGLKTARQELLELLRERQAAAPGRFMMASR
jgi:Domain of unknown function (DUF4124)